MCVGAGQLLSNHVAVETDWNVRPFRSKRLTFQSVSTAMWLLNNCPGPTYAVCVCVCVCVCACVCKLINELSACVLSSVSTQRCSNYWTRIKEWSWNSATPIQLVCKSVPIVLRGKPRKTIQYESVANGFGCMTTKQHGNRHWLRTHRSLGALCSCGHDSCKPCCAASYVMCARVCVVISTRKILPLTMWLCSEEHTFAKKVAYVVVSTIH